MADEFSMRIEGARELAAKLRALPAAAAGKNLRLSVAKGARVFRDAAKRNAPEDEGDLIRNIRTRTLFSGRESAEVMVFVRTRGKGSAPHAHLVEFGTAPHVIKAGSARRRGRRRTVLFESETRGFFGKDVQHPGAPAHPFMRPSFDENREKVVRTIADDIRRRLEREARRK